MAAIIELYANNAYSTLASSTTTTATTITVVDGSAFPNPVLANQFFRMTITGASSPNTVIEIVYVTARSGNVMTVIRGREGTSGVAWSINDLCANEATAGTYNQFMQPYVAIDSGTTDAYVVSTPQHQNVYYFGMPLVFSTLNTNTITNPTINLNGMGARTIQNADGSALQVGQIQANTPISLLFNDEYNTWLMQSPLGYQSKLNLVGSRAVFTDSAGDLSTGVVTATEGSYLAGVTSSIQAQLNAKTEFSDFPYYYDVPTGTGYQKFPSGMYMQWGSVANIPPGSQTITVTLPIAWQVRYMSGVVTDAGGACIPYGITAGVSNASIKIYAPYAILNGAVPSLSPVTRGTTGATWIAFGY